MNRIFSVVAFIAVLMLTSCNQNTTKENKENGEIKNDSVTSMSEAGANDIKPEHLTAQTFKEKVWDYDTNPDQWIYKGTLPCVIDFYADWCKPCKMVAPIMDDLADKYDGKVLIYKIDTDKEKELATVFQITSIPAVLFSPMDGKPAMQPGALSKDDYIGIIDEFILKTKKENSKNI